MISLLVTYFVREHWVHWNTSFKRKSRGNDTITKTDRGESYSKPVESTRSNEWTAGHLHSEHTSRLPGSTVTFRLRSGFTFTPHLFFLRAEKSTLPARTSLCSLLPCGSPLPYLSSLLSSSVLSPLPLTSALTSPLLSTRCIHYQPRGLGDVGIGALQLGATVWWSSKFCIFHPVRLM